MSSDSTSLNNVESLEQDWIPNRENVGIPDNPFRYQFPHHIGPSIIFGPYLNSRPVLAPVDQMFRRLYIRNLPKPTSLYLLLRILKRIKISSWEIRQYLRRYGPEVKKRHHRSIPAQFWDLVRLQLFTEESSQGYYEGQMARHHGSRNLLAYLPYLEYVWTAIQMQRDLFGVPPFFLNYKVSFSQWARANGIATPLELIVCEGAISSPTLETELIALGSKIILKPSNLLSGEGVEAWEKLADGSWQGDQELLETPQFVQRIHDLTRRYQCSMIVQKRINNHPDLILDCGETLSTGRITTIINENGSPEAVEFRWRMRSEEGVVADNGGQGGTYWRISNFDTGYISGGDLPIKGTISSSITHHPINGRKMVGSHHPFAKEFVEFALAGHLKMPNVLLVGWDIAMSPQGPIAIEVNFPAAATASIQKTCDGFENARYGEILGHHARRWLATMTPNHTTI